jgi:DNA-3-methyladenine glycosylase II
VIQQLAFTETFTVQAAAPFNFDLTAQIFSSGDQQIRNYTNQRFSQVLYVNGKLCQLNAASAGSVSEPKISVELKSNNPLTLQDRRKAEEAVKFIFNLDFDLCSFYRDIENDGVLHQITGQLFGLKNPTTPTVFEALVDSIVEQQISIKVAHTIEERLIKKFGETLALNGETYYAYPTPQNMACSSAEEIQGCGLTQRKAQYIHGAAQMIVDGKLDLEHMKTLQKPEETIAALDAIRGIGVWTAELTMLRGMQKLDALPADDLGVRRVISRYYCGGKPIKAAEAREIAGGWGRWKGLAAFYLIIAEIKDLKAS